MRKILKALSLVMVLVMCFTMVFTTAVSAEGTPTLTINSAAVKEGETVTITVDAANFGTVAGAHFVVALPAELTDVVVADSDYVAYDAEAATVSFVKEAAWTDGVCDGIADGTLVTITAKAAVGTYVVDFAETGKTTDFCDANLAEVAVTKVAGEVVVETAGTPINKDITITPFIYVGTKLGVMFQLQKTQLSQYADYELVIDRQIYDGDYNVDNAKTVTVKKAEMANATKAKPYYIYTGVGMYELGLEMYAYVNCYDANGNLVAVSNTWSSTMATIIKQSCVDSTDTYAQTAYADMLNMSAAAQTYFGNMNAGSDLASETLVNLPDATIGYDGDDYASKEVGDLNVVTDGVKWAEDSPLATSHSFQNSIYFGESVSVAYLLRDKNNVIDLSKLSMTVTYDSLYPAGPVTKTVSGDDWNDGSWINFSFSDAYLYDTDKVITATITYDGKEVLTGKYTVETYCNQVINSTTASADALALTTATAKFGIASRAYFSNLTGNPV